MGVDMTPRAFVVALVVTLFISVAPAPANAQRLAKDPAGLTLIQQSCRNVTNRQQLAECLWAALRARKIHEALVNTDLLEAYFRQLVGGESDYANCKGIVVGYPSVPNSPGEYEEGREVLQRLHKISLPPLRDCQEANALYREVVGIPPSWEKCTDRPYDYQHFEDCMTPALVGREGAEAAIRRFYERGVKNPETDAVFSTETVAQSLAAYAHRIKSRRDTMALEAKNCISSNRRPFSAQTLYARTATASIPEPQFGQPGGIQEQRAAKVGCEDVIKFAIKFNIIPDPTK